MRVGDRNVATSTSWDQGVHTTSRRLDHFPYGTAIGYAGETEAVNSERERDKFAPVNIYVYFCKLQIWLSNFGIYSIS